MAQTDSAPFSATFRVGWAQIDANAHMRNTAYLELCVDVRFMYFQAHGFPAQEFERQRIGPASGFRLPHTQRTMRSQL